MQLRDTSTFSTLFKYERMKINKLPTYIDIDKHYFYITSFTHKSVNDRIYLVVDEIISIWESASVPYISRHSIYNKLKRHIPILLKFKKNINKQSFNDSLKKYYLKFNTLFDICPCSCDLRSHRIKRVCNCIRINRIPEAEITFMIDMRSDRNMTIDISRRCSTSYQSRISCNNIDITQVPQESSSMDVGYDVHDELVSIYHCISIIIRLCIIIVLLKLYIYIYIYIY